MANSVTSRAGRLVWAALLLLSLSISPAWAQGQEPEAQRPIQIDRNAVLILIRTTLLALDQANRTGNYTVLRDLGAPAFQQANTASRLSEIFANLRTQDLDLSGAAVLEPQLTLLPQLEPNGLMHMTGFFPSIPLQIHFDLFFAAVDGRWRPFGLSIRVSPSLTAAPAAQAASAQVPEAPRPTTGARVASPPAATRPAAALPAPRSKQPRSEP